MPRRRTSLKSNRVNKRKRDRNLKVKSRLKKAIKKLQELIAKKDAESKTFISKVFSQLDKAAKKKIIHPATANRRKSRLTLKLRKSA
ncbi:MAG: 30S ribosomal protein S20 [Candidatus Omnitrophica bacterium]|nr:30S ribosomal protein S20 [Candidatus Omnitrophota bacterium]